MIIIAIYKKILIGVALVYISLLMGCERQATEVKQVNVVFRYDDYSALSSTKMELSIIDAFRKNNATITFGVVPFICGGEMHDTSPKVNVPLTSEKFDILKTYYKDGILDIALHGYNHQTISVNKMTEFSGLDYLRQKERLGKGKKFLESIIDAQITTFVPPWNSYDLNTLHALEELGFTTLSASDRGEATEESKLSFLPATCDLLKVLDAVKAARTSSDTQPVIVVLFHEYDFKEINEKMGSITYQEFCDLLYRLKSQRNVRLLSISQATKIINDLSVNRFLLTKRYYSISNLLPSLLRKENIIQYQESPELLITTLKVCVFYLTVVSIGAIISFLFGILILHKPALIMKTAVLCSIVVSLILLVYTCFDWKVGPKGMTASACIFGVCIGLFTCSIYFRKKSLHD